MSPDEAIYRYATHQLGLVTIHQLKAAGLSRDQVAVRLRRRQLFAVRRGVYRLAGAPMTWETAVMAAVLAAPCSAVASHLTAATIWTPALVDARRADVELTGPRQARMEGVVMHRSLLPTWQRARMLELPVTTPARTVVDLAGVVDSTTLARVTDELIRRRLLRLQVVQDVVATLPGIPTAIRGLLGERLGEYRPNDSAWETQMDALYDSLGLPPAVRQYEIWTPGGVYRVDRAIVELRIGVEWKGYRWHGGRAAFDTDADREADLASVGWQLLWFTSRSSPERIRAAILGAVATRRRQLAAGA